LEVNAMTDATTLYGKLVMGYQGWFAAAGDGSPFGGWFHYFSGSVPLAQNLVVDFWPDMSELAPDEKYPTLLTLNGAPATLFSSYRRPTVERHFRWMSDYGIDGVFLQRFVSEIYDPQSPSYAVRNAVLDNVRQAARLSGRSYAVEYDCGMPINLAGNPAIPIPAFIERLKEDFLYLRDSLRVTSDDRYWKHNGRPVVALYGFGFDAAWSPYSALQAKEIFDWFRSHGMTVVAGVPACWRTPLDQTCPGGGARWSTSADPVQWSQALRAADILKPWTVGIFNTNAGIDMFKSRLIADMQYLRGLGREIMPVVWPGFSWYNLRQKDSINNPSNAIPRNGGLFYWRQVYDALSAFGVAGMGEQKMLFNAMFDEIDEGTAMFKLAPTPTQIPVQVRSPVPGLAVLVSLNVDGYDLSSDWYLQVAGEAAKMIRGETSLTPNIRPFPPRRIPPA
jgi:hypothetical protein